MDLPNGKKTERGLYLTAKEASALIQKEATNLLFIDVRTQAEIAFVGVPTVIDANIPYELIEDWQQWDDKGKNFKMTVNDRFVSAVEDRLHQKGLNKQIPVILMCRSGYRSASAANLLTKAGYQNVYSLVDGFEGDKATTGHQQGQRVVNGWKNSQLRWTDELDKAKMYF
ncbi:MAG: sulfurtransferase [Candidatus Parabeggiatoa sp. nov. 1]|nr:MAG: sulfurtransferase [Gammaproteobacteria bacterium]